MNHYKCSDGTRVSKSEIDKRVWETKRQKLEDQFNCFGYNFCEKATIYCEMSEECHILDCSHNVSVKVCQELGQSELAWDLRNITILERKCHRIHDKTDLRWKTK